MNPYRLYFVWRIRVKLGMSSQKVSYLFSTPMGDSERKKNISSKYLIVAIVVGVLASLLIYH